MNATIVTTDKELEQIIQLSHKNLRTNISVKEQTAQGFITWNYSLALLQKMNAQHPHVIVKENDTVIGYALVALKNASRFHPELKTMVFDLDKIDYYNKKLGKYNYYVMGQICIDHAYRGKGVFEMLYQYHKKLFEKEYDFVVTEISSRNTRSLRAHEKAGFKIIHTYRNTLDEWNAVLWNWK